ncbi:transmembrane protein 180 isoform X5 [Canis lupus familiaris]|uniref:transmembrane protein 180 isoform X5 n=2 Tax=Canis lupus TaxID=9612 RepID=UPI000BAA09C2|nr:transmembrane protein 180 isoform X5 [Canis lupus familiaris]XP_038400697.1 transmembrane protein 180 isoform X5 [Canis lupus familiaris]XP_038524790.1 transmembrane protein 180 isoform X5 [Canis lupus familiaris]|eukprot:XP_022275665.1 transmembrane protein 180 isoform X5 [Canis lupus familiaris]
MTLLSIKPIAWGYSMITLGTEMLNSVFSFYYVKLFLHLYKISEVAFYQAQMILMIWNALNDLTGYFHNNSQADCCSSRRSSVLYGAPLYSIAFLLPWFPWKYYQEGDWLSGLHLVVSLCAFDSTLTFVQQAQCTLFAEIFTRHESRLQLIKINQMASLVGSTSILFCGLISDNMEILLNFQAVAVVIAILASASLYTGMYHMNRFEPKRSLEENLFSESEQDLPWTSVVSLMRQVLTQKNFCLFLCLVLISQSWLKKFGYYKIILISFYLEGTASIVMLLLGQQYYYFLALYLTIIMVIVQASFCLFNLPLADMVDADLLKFNRQSPLSSMVFGINALFTKPAQSLAPMMILSKLKQYGYGNPDKSTILDLHDAMFNLICLVPLGIVLIQILVWSPFSIRNKTDYTGAL